MCIGGFLQPLPFVQKHYYTINESNDGFADRIFLCTPKPKLLKEDEVKEWVIKLQDTGLTDLKQLYKLIRNWHSNREVTYTFDAEEKEVYKQFADQIVYNLISKLLVHFFFLSLSHLSFIMSI